MADELNTPFGVVLGKDVAANAANSASTGLIGGILDLLKMSKSQKYNLKNQELANEYAMQQQENSAALQMSNWTDMFNASNARQDFLLQNQKAMEVAGMRNAGMNPSLASGQTQLAAVSNPSAAAPSGSAAAASGPMSNMVALSNQSQLANIRLMNSQAHLNEAKAGEAESNETKNMFMLFPELENMEAGTKLVRATEMLTNEKILSEQEQRRYVHVLTDNLEAMAPLQRQNIIAQTDLFAQEFMQNYESWDIKFQTLVATLTLLNEQIKTEYGRQSELAASAKELFSRTLSNLANAYEANVRGKNEQEHGGEKMRAEGNANDSQAGYYNSSKEQTDFETQWNKDHPGAYFLSRILSMTIGATLGIKTPAGKH